MGEQQAGMAGVFTRYDVYLAQHVQRPQGDVRPVADRYRDKVNAVFHFRHKQGFSGTVRAYPLVRVSAMEVATSRAA